MKVLENYYSAAGNGAIVIKKLNIIESLHYKNTIKKLGARGNQEHLGLQEDRGFESKLFHLWVSRRSKFSFPWILSCNQNDILCLGHLIASHSLIICPKFDELLADEFIQLSIQFVPLQTRNFGLPRTVAEGLN